MYETLHQRGIIHGEVHPRHIRSDKDGQFKLIDFDRGQVVESGSWPCINEMSELASWLRVGRG